MDVNEKEEVTIRAIAKLENEALKKSSIKRLYNTTTDEDQQSLINSGSVTYSSILKPEESTTVLTDQQTSEDGSCAITLTGFKPKKLKQGKSETNSSNENIDSDHITVYSGDSKKPILKIPTIYTAADRLSNKPPSEKECKIQSLSKKPSKRKKENVAKNGISLNKSNQTNNTNSNSDVAQNGEDSSSDQSEKQDGWPSRHRIEYTHEEQTILNTHYKYNHFPNATEISVIAHRLGIRHKQVIYWFQNRRSKERKDNPRSKSMY